MKIDYQAYVRRIERGKWYWMEKAVIREYTPKVGALGIAVYNYLASLVDLDQSCFPSQRRIGEVLGYSRTTINRAIKRLERHGLIVVDKSARYQHTYRLLRARCKPDAPETSAGGNLGVKQEHTTNN